MIKFTYKITEYDYILEQFKNVEWFYDVVKYYNNDEKKIIDLIGYYTGAGIIRLEKLDILVRGDSTLFDKNSNKTINYNYVKLMLADYLRHATENTKYANCPIPSKPDRNRIAVSIMKTYIDFAVEQIRKYVNGEPVNDIGTFISDDE